MRPTRRRRTLGRPLGGVAVVEVFEEALHLVVRHIGPHLPALWAVRRDVRGFAANGAANVRWLPGRICAHSALPLPMARFTAAAAEVVISEGAVHERELLELTLLVVVQIV